MIDLDKLIYDFMSFEYKGEELKDFSRAEINTIKSAIWFIGRSLRDALEKQGLEYKDGAIKPIESMFKFKEGDILSMYDEYIGLQNEIARLKAKLRDYGCEL